MAVKLADTLAPMGNFPVADSSNITIQVNGTTKTLQQAMNDGDLKGVGTTYNAGQTPDDTNLATNGSVARAYSDAKNRPVLTSTPNYVQGGIWIG